MDEDSLLVGLRRGDPEAVQQMVETCGQRLLRSATLLCGNEPDAQDLVQETFVQALKGAERFHGRSSLYTWLNAILLNLCRHHFRDRRRWVYNDDVARQEASLEEESPHRLDSEAACGALGEALRRLSSDHREVLVLRFYEEMKIHEIAAHLGLSKGTVKSRLHYALAQMQRLMPGELNLFGQSGTKEMENK